MQNILKDSIILITGGTGTFGSAFIERCLKYFPKEIRIFSRGEKKQYDLKQKYNNISNIKFYIGDIRDKSSVDKVMKNVDYVFHAAAMKHVPICEENPIEAIKINIIGSNNILDSAIEHQVKKVICLSTDKAVYPSSLMGITKAGMEKVALSKAKEQNNTQIVITRFCNLLISNGSVVPLFIDQIKNNKPLTITNPNMTRFFMTLNDALDLIEEALFEGKNGDIYVKKASSCSIKFLTDSIKELLNVQNYPEKILGERPGEKTHEYLITKEELPFCSIKNNYFIISQNIKNNIDDYNEMASNYYDNYFKKENFLNILNEEMESNYGKKYPSKIKEK